MARRLLLALCVAPLLLARGQVSDLQTTGQGTAEALRALAPARRLDAFCTGGVNPLLWTVKKGDDHTTGELMYLLGDHHIVLSDILPVPDQVAMALQFADVAFFDYACSAKDDSMGSYFDHCKEYHIEDFQDSIASRLMPQDIAALQAGMKNVIDVAYTASTPCIEAEGAIKKLSMGLNQTTSHVTLFALFQEVLEAINPTTCTLATGAESFQDVLRNTFGNVRPTFGLIDPGEKCKEWQGRTVDQDVLLARKMWTHFQNKVWVEEVIKQMVAMEDVMKCGDLTKLTKMEGLPWLNVEASSEQNPTVVASLMKAFKKFPGKIIVAPVNVGHLVPFDDGSGSPAKPSVLDLLTRAGYTVERATASTILPGTPSTFQMAGAKENMACLKHPDKDQPESCTVFREAITDELKLDPFYGAIKNTSDCAPCVNSNVSCTCEVTWSNTTAFEDLCTRQVVDGVSGKVYYTDMERNPGSKREGAKYSQKTVYADFLNCYASTCDTLLLQEAQLRNWYKKGEDLAEGRITIRDVATLPGGSLGAQLPGMGNLGDFPSPMGGKWPAWAWGAVLLGIVAVMALLTSLFMMPKKGKNAAKTTRGLDMSGQGQPLTTGSPYQDPYGDYADPYGQQPLSPEMQQVFQPPEPNRGPVPFPAARGRVPPTQQAYDSALLQQAMEMTSRLGDAGTQAVQQMQSQVLQGMQMPGTQQGMQMQPMPMQGNPYQQNPYSPNMATQHFGGGGTQPYMPMPPMTTQGNMGGYYGGAGH